MNKKLICSLTLICGFALPCWAAAPNSYEVTGPVLAVTDSVITVQKGKEKWELARTADTKIAGDLKVGAKVTIKYTMTATAATVKPEKAEKAAAKAGASASPKK